MNSANGKTCDKGIDESDEDDGLLEDSSSDGASSDECLAVGTFKVSKPGKKKVMRLSKNEDVEPMISTDGGGSMFNSLATKFQEERARQGLPTRKKKNNIWGSILQEEHLASGLTSIGVGRSLKDFDSDRGAESYDFVLAQEHEAELRAKCAKEEEEREGKVLNDELDDYWSKVNVLEDDEMETGTSDSRRGNAIQAGKKRSVKDRLGARTHRRDRRNCSKELEDMSIPPPGVSRTIPDLSVEILKEGTDNEFGREIAYKLSEPKTQLMVGVLEIVGRQVMLELFAETQKVELGGGMMIKNGERRRTPGGVFFQLLRDIARSDDRVDERKIKKIFARGGSIYPDRRYKLKSLDNTENEVK